MKSVLSSRFAPALVLISLLAVGLGGCGGDDDSPTDPGNGNQNPPADTFDQSTAQLQAQTAAPQAIAMVESMSSFAIGLGGKEGEYSYNEERNRWEWHWTYSAAGYTYDWLYTVQYLDEMGAPQTDATGASSFRHTMTGTASYDVTDQGTRVVYDYVYYYDTTVSGISTGTLTMTGEGGYDYDYSYDGNGNSFDYSYVIDWQILGGGITQTAGGCPTGTIRYTFSPYTMDVVFDGTSTATTSMTDAAGNDVPVNPSTHDLSCTVK